MLTEACRVWNAALGLFAVSLSIAWICWDVNSCKDCDIITHNWTRPEVTLASDQLIKRFWF